MSLSVLLRTLTICVLLSITALAQAPIPLNSERIEARFGSYAIEVLEHSSELRISNLYSIEGDTRVTRTFAVVAYPTHVDAALTSEHEAILAGGSIGAVFAANGWRVYKHNRLIGTVQDTEKLRALMRREHEAALALHVYSFEVERDRERHEYALIAEIHHPDYLSERELAAIYGPVPPLTRAQRRTLERVLDAVRRAVAD